MAHSARRHAVPWLFLCLRVCLDVCVCAGHFTIPLKIYAGETVTFNSSVALDLTRARARARGGGGGSSLALASDPAGLVDFLDMVNNLQGDSGRGYYIQMSIGTPAQKVSLLFMTKEAQQPI